MKLIGLISHLHNALLDKDFIWWPFSFLRPDPKIPMTFKLTLLMTACFGGLTFLFFTIFAVMNNFFTIESAFTTFLSCFLGFFLWFNIITKPLWNVRAKKLDQKKGHPWP